MIFWTIDFEVGSGWKNPNNVWTHHYFRARLRDWKSYDFFNGWTEKRVINKTNTNSDKLIKILWTDAWCICIYIYERQGGVSNKLTHYISPFLSSLEFFVLFLTIFSGSTSSQSSQELAPVLRWIQTRATGLVFLSLPLSRMLSLSHAYRER